MEAYIRVAALLEKNSRDKRRNIKPTEEADRHISKQNVRERG